MFPLSAPVSEEDTLLYNSPNENHITHDPDQGLPGSRADPDQQHERGYGSLHRGAGRAPGFDPGQGVLLGVPPDLCLHVSDDALPHDGARPARRRRWLGFAPDVTLTLATNAGPFLVTSPNTGVSYPARLGADGDVGQGQYRHPADEHVEREDQHVHRRWPHVPVRACCEHSERRQRGGHDPERGHDNGSREGRGRRQHLLRRLEYELHGGHRGPAAPAASAPAAAATTTTSATSTATPAAGALPRPERDRAPARNGEESDPRAQLPHRQSAPGAVEAEASRARATSEPEGRSRAGAWLQGHPGGRPAVALTHARRNAFQS